MPRPRPRSERHYGQHTTRRTRHPLGHSPLLPSEHPMVTAECQTSTAEGLLQRTLPGAPTQPARSTLVPHVLIGQCTTCCRRPATRSRAPPLQRIRLTVDVRSKGAIGLPLQPGNRRQAERITHMRKKRKIVRTSVDAAEYERLHAYAVACSCTLPEALRCLLRGSAPLTSRRPGSATDLQIRKLAIRCVAALRRRPSLEQPATCAWCSMTPSPPPTLPSAQPRRSGLRAGRKPQLRTSVSVEMHARLSGAADACGCSLSAYLRTVYARHGHTPTVAWAEAMSPHAAHSAIATLAHYLGPAPMCDRCTATMVTHLAALTAGLPAWPEITLLREAL
jgi:hypothetical protein